MKTLIQPDHRAFAETLRRRVLEGPGHTRRTLRQRVAACAAGYAAAEPPYGELARQIGEGARHTTDQQVANVRTATGSDKAAFEVILTAAVGAGLLRWRRAIDILDEATDAAS